MGLRRQLTRRIVWRRFAEPSTWAGIVTAFAVIAGINLTPEKRDAIITVGVLVASVLLGFVREASPGQVAKSALNAATGEDKVDAKRVHETIEVAKRRAEQVRNDPPWHERPVNGWPSEGAPEWPDQSPRRGPYPVSNDDPS